MRYLTCSSSDGRDNMINGIYAVQGTSSTLAQLLQVVVAYENDGNEDDPDGYWHP